MHTTKTNTHKSKQKRQTHTKKHTRKQYKMQVTAQVTNNCCLLIIEIALTRKTIYQINNSQKKNKIKSIYNKKKNKIYNYKKTQLKKI